ncbi:hypothetical protein Jiend_15880 [Micromonospora endophytica]|nr:hypothetical protein Jiend_15880 [Micromonospora endophytica]
MRKAGDCIREDWHDDFIHSLLTYLPAAAVTLRGQPDFGLVMELARQAPSALPARRSLYAPAYLPVHSVLYADTIQPTTTE